MKNLSSKAIILGKKDFGDKNHLLTIYTEEFGKLSVITKGSRKLTSRFTGHLETLSLCHCQIYQGPKNKILTEISTINNHPQIRSNLQKITSASKILEITNKLVFLEQKIPGLFPLLQQALLNINNQSNYSLITLNYSLKLLDKLGIIPNLQEIDSLPHQKYLNFFSLLKNREFTEISNIKLQEKEALTAENLVKKIIERELEREIKTF